MNKPLILTTSARALIMFTVVAQAKVYQWTDSNGNVVFSDIPPELDGTETVADVSQSELDNAGQATALALQARERIMNNPFSLPERAVAKQEIDAAQRLDQRNAMIEVALSELMLKQAYYSGDAFKAKSYNTAGLNNALQHAKNAVEYSPENVLCLAQLAKVLLIQGQKDAFVEVLRQMHNVASETYYTWYLQSVLARKLNNIPRVQEALAQAEKYAETIYQQKGLEEERRYLARKQGDVEAEERSYKKLIQLNPDSAHAHGNYGSFLLRNKRYEDAIAALNKAISIQPYPMALELLARAESAQAKNAGVAENG
ncbi:DUF4124 domain-containing protein [Rheinheimera baltica]|uniref:DUF4124 domain-containing protein n=1 Tax=Rheinheimera baltica TaxID=67576 RepID=UPI00273DB71F|nr:DUF4124 domain-containing protein [Rheinheimera baltica]MDP5192022.1 DUF4124 domain-containing protein [Rheinheimera baltica]